MSPWTNSISVPELNGLLKNTINERLGIEILELGPDYVRASMPVDARTRQPAGLLHGGASAVLAETLGSVAAHMCLDPATHHCVGVEVSASHVRAAREGRVIGTVRPVHVGKRNQVWEIRINNEQEQLVAIAKLTTTTLPNRD